MISIRRRLTLFLCLSMAGLLVVTGMGVFLGMKELLNERFNETLEAKAMALVTASEVDDGEFEVDMTVQDFAGFGVGGDDFFEIRRKGGGLVLRSPSMKFHGRVVERFARLPVARATGALVFDDQLANGEAARFYVRMIYPKDDFEDRFQDVYLIVGSPTRGIHRDLRLLGTVLLVAGGLAILLIPPLVGIGLGRGLKPLKVFSTEIGEIRADRLEQRLEIAQIPKELAPVAEGLNAWLDRLEESFERERRFSANAAHELRTPLSELRSMAELGARWADEATPERCREMVSVTQEMGDLIERLSLLARADAGQQGIRIERMKVGEIANAGLLRFREMAEERGISMSTRVIDGEFCSDRVLWMAIFANMVGNAVSHAPRGSEIGITVSAEEITVENPAPEMRQEDIGHLYERFWRKDPSRAKNGHSGLGLSIVKACAELLNATCVAELKDGSLRTAVKWPGAADSVCLSGQAGGEELPE